jgi:hypothetical protein
VAAVALGGGGGGRGQGWASRRKRKPEARRREQRLWAPATWEVSILATEAMAAGKFAGLGRHLHSHGIESGKCRENARDVGRVARAGSARVGIVFCDGQRRVAASRRSSGDFGEGLTLFFDAFSGETSRESRLMLD